MARIVCIAVLVFMMNLMVGCNRRDSGSGQLLPERTMVIDPIDAAQITDAGEIDLVEEMTIHRQAYRQGLEMLVAHYNQSGNNMKLTWAKKELKALDTMPQYKYIIEATVAGPNLRAVDSIPEADALYAEAVALQKDAEKLLVVKNKDRLRLALDKYNLLIRSYPSSDKIDDVAFKAAGIYEHFKDYSIAVVYFERAYQWDPATVHPARFRRAYILDQRLRRRAEALELYQKALEIEGPLPQNASWKEYAAGRIAELSNTPAPAPQP